MEEGGEMNYTKLLKEVYESLDFPRVSTAYIDINEGGVPVCNCCGSYYVVNNGELKVLRNKIKGTLTKALKEEK